MLGYQEYFSLWPMAQMSTNKQKVVCEQCDVCSCKVDLLPGQPGKAQMTVSTRRVERKPVKGFQCS